MVPVDRYLKVVPLADGLERPLAFRSRLDYPSPPAALIQAAGMIADIGINLHLHAFDVRAVLRIDARDSGVEKNAAVAAFLALETEAQIEVAIGLLRRQVAVFVVGALTKDRVALRYPLFFAVVLPTGEVLAVEQRHPAAPGRRLR